MDSKSRGKQIYVGIGVVKKNNRVLFAVRHAPDIPEYDKKFELPGGKIEIGEAPAAAIEREVLEETGFKVKSKHILPFTFDNEIESNGNILHVTVFCSECELIDENQVGKKHDEEHTWINIHDINYANVIPGSKEFLIWLLSDDENIKITDENKEYKIEFENIDEKNNKKRGYQVVIKFDPEKEERFKVLRRYGRVGNKYTTKHKCFFNMKEALDYARKLVEKRKKRGYKVTHYDENHPLRSWFKSIEMPNKASVNPSLFETPISHEEQQ